MQPKYDAFISYSHHDRDWVENWLLSHLENAGVTVCIDFRDFDIGAPSLDNMDEAVARSDKTILVLTPDWVKSEWTSFESLLAQTADPAGVRRRILPLMLAQCDPPRRLGILTWADFRDSKRWDVEFKRVLAAFKKTDDGRQTTDNAAAAAASGSSIESTDKIKTEGQSGGVNVNGGQIDANDIVGHDKYVFQGPVTFYQGNPVPPTFQPGLKEESRPVDSIMQKNQEKPGDRPLRVFISHAAGDEPAAAQLSQKLRAEGFATWLDTEDILPGQQREREIPRAVRASDIVLVCLTQKAVTTAGHVHKEIKYALDVADEQPEDAIFVVPVKLEPCELPDRMSHLAAVNLYEPNGITRLMRALHTRAEQRQC